MEKSETELKKKRTEFRKECSWIDHAIGYFSAYGEPFEYRGIRKHLMDIRQKLDSRLKEIEKQIKHIRATK